MDEQPVGPSPESAKAIAEIIDYIKSLPPAEGAAMGLHFSLSALEMKTEVTLTDQQAEKYTILLARLEQIMSEGGIKDANVKNLVNDDFTRLKLYLNSARRN
ncbi:MAG TPA: hypothetical protein VJH63_03335 [Candidatus Paceibacterota bacterium]